MPKTARFKIKIEGWSGFDARAQAASIYLWALDMGIDCTGVDADGLAAAMAEQSEYTQSPTDHLRMLNSLVAFVRTQA